MAGRLAPLAGAGWGLGSSIDEYGICSLTMTERM